MGDSDDEMSDVVDAMRGSSIANASHWEESEEDLIHPKKTTNDLTIPEDDANVQLLMREWKNEEETEEEEVAVSIELVNAITNEVLHQQQQQHYRSRNMALIRRFRQKILQDHRQLKNRLDRKNKRHVVMNEDEESNLHRLCDDMGINPAQFYHGDQQLRHQRRQSQRRYNNISSESLFASFSSTNGNGGWVRYCLSASCLVGFATLMSIAIMEGLAHTRTSLRSQNNGNNVTTVKDEPKIWWEHVNDEKNVIPIGEEGQDWEGGRPDIIQSTTASSLTPKVDADLGIEDIIQPPPHLASTSNSLHPTWYSIEAGGWSGGTHVDALRFCVQNKDQQLCPIKQVCPNGPSQPPLTGAHFVTTKDVGQQWVPVIDAPNTWVLIKTMEGESQALLCMDYTTLIGFSSDDGGGPLWGLDESEPGLKRHILCCTETRISGGINGDGGG